MSCLRTVKWAELCWPEILEYLKSGPRAVILPVGATEQHGPHMGCGMDSCAAELFAHAAAERCGVPVLPTLHYGSSIGHSHRWPGTVSVSPQTLITMVAEMGEWLFKAGFERLFIVNGHVGNAAALRCALDLLRSRHDGFMVALFSDADLSPRFADDAADWHANDAETSLMMAKAPHMVQEEARLKADDPDRTNGLVFAHPVNRTSLNGVTGFPSHASVEKGQRLYEEAVNTLSERIARGLLEQAPLPEAYYQRIEPTTPRSG